MGLSRGTIRPMKPRPLTAAAALLLAAGSLAACSAPKAAPAPSKLATYAAQFCDDLGDMSYASAIDRMATRASKAGLSSSEQDSVVDLAAKQCPGKLP